MWCDPYLLNNIHAFYDTAEDNVLSIQPGGLHSGDEELASVGVRSSIRHRQDTCHINEIRPRIKSEHAISQNNKHTRSKMLQWEAFIFKLGSIDRFASSAVVVGEVTSLAHEVGDNTVEDAVLVSKSLLSGAQGTEILGGLRYNIGPQLRRETCIRYCARSTLTLQKVHDSRRHVLHDQYVRVLKTGSVKLNLEWMWGVKLDDLPPTHRPLQLRELNELRLALRGVGKSKWSVLREPKRVLMNWGPGSHKWFSKRINDSVQRSLLIPHLKAKMGPTW